MASRPVIRALLLLMVAQLYCEPSLAQSNYPLLQSTQMGRTKNPIIKLTPPSVRYVRMMDGFGDRGFNYDHLDQAEDYERLLHDNRGPHLQRANDFSGAETWPGRRRADIIRAFEPPVNGQSKPPIADRSIRDDSSARYLNTAAGPSFVISERTKLPVSFRDFLSSSERLLPDDFGGHPSTLRLLRNKWLFPFAYYDLAALKRTRESNNDAAKTKQNEPYHAPRVSEESYEDGARDEYLLDERVEAIGKCPYGTELSAYGYCEPDINAADHENYKTKAGKKRKHLEDFDLDDDNDDDSFVPAMWKKDSHGRSTKNCPPGTELLGGRCREI